MVVYAFYESDTRVLQYATALAHRGDQVDVIALRRDDRAPEFEILDGVNVYRIQTRTINEKGLLNYGVRILRFLFGSTLFLRRKHRKHRYDVVHVHNVPDFLVFSAIFPKRKQTPVILDIHDLLPEFYASKFKVRHGSVIFKLLTFVERYSARFASHIIIANHLWRDRLVSRSTTFEKCTVVRNRPDLDIFVGQTTNEAIRDGKFRLTYPGSLNWHQGVDVAIRAFASVANQIPDAEFHIYGEGPAKPALIALTSQLGMNGRICFHDFLPSREIARVMAATDLAIEPKRASSAFGNEALSTKILEFMALGVPVIASKTKIHAYYYDESIIKYYADDDEHQLARCILEMANDSHLRMSLAKQAAIYASNNSWQAKRDDYLMLVDSLIDRSASASTASGCSQAAASTP